ncbi:Spy/CpxP family protein refolding chaperone [Thermodesulfobacteriota bacterium]
MKKIIIVLSGLFLVTILATSAFSWGNHGRGGGHMMGNWGGDYGDRGQSNYGYDALTEEQRAKLTELDKKFYDETADLRNKMWTKSTELNTLLDTEDPDITEAKALQKEVNDLRAELDSKGLEYQVAVRKIVPDSGFGRGYGRGYGNHMRGYGPETCWN